MGQNYNPRYPMTLTSLYPQVVESDNGKYNKLHSRTFLFHHKWSWGINAHLQYFTMHRQLQRLNNPCVYKVSPFSHKLRCNPNGNYRQISVATSAIILGYGRNQLLPTSASSSSKLSCNFSSMSSNSGPSEQRTSENPWAFV